MAITQFGDELCAATIRGPMKTDVDQFLSARIRQLRDAANLTQQELADLAGITVPTISRVENGHIGLNVGTLGVICRALGISLARFFEAGEPPHGLPPETTRVIELMATMGSDGRAAVLKAVEAIDELIDARR